MNKKNFKDRESPHELLLTTRQTTKIRNDFTNNTSKEIRLSKAQISKIIQSRESFGSWQGNLFKKVVTDFEIPLARDNLFGLVSNLAPNSINKFERKIAARAEKGITLFISNEDMNYIIKIIKSQDSSVLIDGVTE